MKHDVHDVVDAAAQYIEASVRIGTLVALETVVAEDLAEDVRDLLERYRRGDRLTRHRSGDVYETMRPEFKRLHDEG